MEEIRNLKIRKAKLTKGGTIEASFFDEDGNEVSVKCRNKCHNDLRVALARLVPYFADLTEQKEADRIDWDHLDSPENIDLLKNIDVTGVSAGTDEANPIYTLTGKRILFTSRVLNLNSPGVELEDDSFAWPHLNDFALAVDAFFYEVNLYLVAKKWDVVQLEIDFTDGEDPFGGTPDVPDEAPDVA